MAEADPLPLRVTPGQQLHSLQGQIRDSLAQCISAAYMVDDTEVLKEVKSNIESIHSTHWFLLLHLTQIIPTSSQYFPGLSKQG